MGHIHADLMAQYAEDAKQYDKPWELWQHSYNGVWKTCPHRQVWMEPPAINGVTYIVAMHEEGQPLVRQDVLAAEAKKEGAKK